MEGYSAASYGDAFADVYDDWYTGVTDAEATADAVVALAREVAGDRRPRVLELAVGTGRLALPIAARGLNVVGVDASAAMLDRLRARDPAGAVTVHLGDMVDDVPDGPFDVALLAYNSLFNLESAARQQACFAAVVARLAAGGLFVLEAFVPEEPPRRGTVVTVRSMSVAEIVLSISEHDPDTQRAHGHFVQFTDGERVRLRPWSIRYAPPAELDAMAAAAGFDLRARWEDFTRRPFGSDSPQHVSVYAVDQQLRNRNEQFTRAEVTRAYPELHCESVASQPTHWAMGHDRGQAGSAAERLRAARTRARRRPCPAMSVLPGPRGSARPAPRHRRAR